MTMIRKVSIERKRRRGLHALDDAIGGCEVQLDATALGADQDHSGPARLAGRDEHRVSLRIFPSYRKFWTPYRANSVPNKSSIDVPVPHRHHWHIRRPKEINKAEGHTHTLGVYDRLVAIIFGDLKLLDQRDHLRARLEVVVASTPGRHRLLAGFLDLS